MKRIIFTITLMLITFIGVNAEENKIIRLGLVYDGESRMNEQLKQNFVAEAQKILGKSKVTVSTEKASDWTIEGLKNSISTMVKREDVDIVITLGLTGSHIAEAVENNSKFIIAPFLFENKQNGKTESEKTISISSEHRIDKEIDFFSELSKVKKIAIIISSALESDYFPERKGIEKVLEERGIAYKYISYNKPAYELVDSIEKGYGVYFAVLEEISDEEMKKTSEKLIEKKIPSFSMMGSCDVERGILSGYLYKEEIEKRARKTALILQKIYDGEAVNGHENTLIEFEKPVINMGTAKRLGIAPSWSTLDKSVIIDEFKDTKRISLKEMLQEVLEKNSELKLKQKECEVQVREKEEADSKLLPKVTSEWTGVVIDKKSADSSMGLAKETSIKGDLKVTQVIFSEEANMNVDIKGKMQGVKQLEYEQKRQDIIAETVITYLQALKAEANIKIQKNILESSEKNLEISKNRLNRGSINAADVYRWESESAIARNNLVKAHTVLNQIKDNLKRIAMMDKDSEFQIVAEGDTIEFMGIDLIEIGNMIDNSDMDKMLRDYILRKTIDNSVELKFIELERDIKKRYSEYNERDIYMPTIAAQAGYSHKIYESKSADIMESFKPLEQALGIKLPKTEEAPNGSWNIGIAVSFDIFSGGEKKAKNIKSKIELENIIMKRETAENQIKQQVLAEIGNLESEYYNQKNLSIAVKALENNYNLVNEAYQKGQIQIADLLSSRNAIVSVQQAEIVAKYDFWIALVKIERLAGVFLFMDPVRSKSWNNEIKKILMKDMGGDK